MLETERATFFAQWKDLADHILPRRARFELTDVNKGDRRTQKIIDSTATQSVGICSAGIMASVTSPARPWFRLSVPDPEIAEQEDVKEWLHDVEDIISTIFIRSNLYDILPVVYGDMIVFGTAAFAVLEDDEDVIRCYEYPVGSYAIGNDDKLRVRTWVRSFRYSVRQVIERWGDVNPKTGQANFQDGRPSTISKAVQEMWKSGNLEAWVDLVHLIRPNRSYDNSKIAAKYKRFESIYYERGNRGTQGQGMEYGLLEHGGFDEFPVMCLRWEVNSEDVYATNCPGMKALGDIRELQLLAKRMAQGVDKSLNPPLVGQARLQNVRVSTIPGDITYDPGSAQNATDGLRPIYQVKFDLSGASAERQIIQTRIKKAFYEDLFLMISDMDRRQVTATEIDERKEEKLLALGPMLTRIDKDGLSPLVDRTFNIAFRKGLIPPPPEAIQGQQLRVEYVSVMALAQKRVGIEALERTAGFVGQMAQVSPTVLDTVDTDELIRAYADAMGVPPKILVPQEQVDQVRQQRAQQQQQQQAAENAPGLAKAAKDASQASTDQGSVLGNLLAKQRARATLGATSGPVSSGVAA